MPTNYILVVYLKIKDEPPKRQGFKKLTETDYLKLTKDFNSSIGLFGKPYMIIERRWFNININDVDSYFVLVDCVKS